MEHNSVTLHIISSFCNTKTNYHHRRNTQAALPCAALRCAALPSVGISISYVPNVENVPNIDSGKEGNSVHDFQCCRDTEGDTHTAILENRLSKTNYECMTMTPAPTPLGGVVLRIMCRCLIIRLI